MFKHKYRYLITKISRINKITSILFVSLCLTLFTGPSSSAIEKKPNNTSIPKIAPNHPTLSSHTYLVLDYHSNKILAEKNIDLQVEPASLTKMMTMYVIDKEIKSGKLTLDTPVLISKKAWQAPGSRMFVEVNSKVNVEDLIKGIIIQSGNDASIAMAEHIAGSESAFADLMNYYAQTLGMSNSNFENSTGLPQKNHYTTTRDMSVLATELIKEFPDTYKLYAQKEFTYKEIKQVNRNRLLWRSDYIDGIKTGHTDNAGYCLVASGKKDNMRLIAVIMGAKNDEIRTNEANKLLTWGFRFFETRKIYHAEETIQDLRVWMGTKKHISIGLNKDLYITIPQGWSKNTKASIKFPKIAKAPFTKGEAIGTYQIELYDEIITQQDIIALENIKSGNIWRRFVDMLSLTASSLWDKANSYIS